MRTLCEKLAMGGRLSLIRPGGLQCEAVLQMMRHVEIVAKAPTLTLDALGQS